MQLPVGAHQVPIRAIALIVLLLVLVGSLPVWPYSRTWGYNIAGGAGLLVLVLLVLIMFGYV